MTTLRRLLQEIEAWGWMAPVCGGLLLAAAGLHGLLSAAWQSQTQEALAELKAEAQAAKRAASGQLPAIESDALAALPAADGMSPRLGELMATASVHGLRLGNTDITYPQTEGAGVVRWQVAMPVQGLYADLRNYLQAALAADASLSLQSLRLSRQRADSADLQAELVWVLHAKANTAGTP